MNQHLNQAYHNKEFLRSLTSNFPNSYFDWKITVTFYIALHYMRVFAFFKDIQIGHTHQELKQAIDNRELKISAKCNKAYTNLFRYSRQARYDGFIKHSNFNRIMEGNFHAAKVYLGQVSGYIESQNCSLSAALQKGEE